MKKLVLEGVFIKKFDIGFLRIIEQTHRGNGFGIKHHEHINSDRFIADNGVNLISTMDRPFYSGTFVKTLIVRFDDKYDNEVIVIKGKQDYDAVREAVRQYNKYFDDNNNSGLYFEIVS